MISKPIIRSILSILLLLVALPLAAAAPQFTVAAAHYAFSSHSSNWGCDTESEVEVNCKSDYPPPSYTFMHQAYYTEDPITGTYVGWFDGGARDNGFRNTRGDNPVTFLLNGPQGGTHTLRQSYLKVDSQLGCVHNETGGDCQWESDDTMWGDPSAGLDAFYALVFVVDNGHLGEVQDEWFLAGESSNGVSDFTWHEVYYSSRPTAHGSGSAHLFNKHHFAQDPNDSSRWIGLVSWTFNDGSSGFSGTTPVYLKPATEKFGVLFENAGWCEYDWGQDWTSFSDNDSCGYGTNTISDNLYRISGTGFKNNHDLELVDGKALVLQMWGATPHCDQWQTIDGGAYQSAGMTACIDDHTPCPQPSEADKDRYETRRNESWLDGARFWTVRELDLSTWDTSSTGHQWNGAKTTILDGAQHEQFHINPTDVKTTGSYHGGSLKQFSDGRVYLYLPIKHSLCLPDESGFLTYDRPPNGSSGASVMWLRLSS